MGLTRHPDAPAPQRVEAMVYLAGLRPGLGDVGRAAHLLDQVAAIDLTQSEAATSRTALEAADELAEHVPPGAQSNPEPA